MSDDEKIAKIRRENLQLIIYIIVAVCICFSWLLGLMQASFLWIFLLILSLFLLWKTKVFALTEEFIRFKELQLHRKKALRQTETSEWLNFLIHKWSGDCELVTALFYLSYFGVCLRF
jgi:Ca2+-dependent lipid-binding protein